MLTLTAGNVDYTELVAVPLTFSSSQPQITIPIAITNDRLVEDDETFSAIIILPAPIPRVTLSPNMSELTITDSDSEPTCPHNGVFYNY